MVHHHFWGTFKILAQAVYLERLSVIDTVIIRSKIGIANNRFEAAVASSDRLTEVKLGNAQTIV
jgi:hypothetical protein